MALCLGLPGWAGTRKVKPTWILLKPETVSGSGISWDICKFAPRSRQITMPVPHRSVFYRPDALPAAQPTVSTKHWRHCRIYVQICFFWFHSFLITFLIWIHPVDMDTFWHARLRIWHSNTIVITMKMPRIFMWCLWLIDCVFVQFLLVLYNRQWDQKPATLKATPRKE